MKMSKLSNQTNSQDPQAVNSRVFVGNLNTFQCSKTDVERMFQKYGRLAGISMHKGYAFVQFTNPFDARNACHGEDGRNILSQVLDVNMVAEPKPHQIGRKRQNVSKTGNDWDYYYDSYYSSTIYPTSSPRPIKRQRLMTPQNRENLVVNTKMNGPQQQQILIPTNVLSNGNCLPNNMNGCNGAGAPVTTTASAATMNGEQISTMYHHVNGHHQQQHLLGPFKVYSNPDTLICGNCRECFSDFRELLEHKRSYCKLRFTCKCQENASKNTPTSTTRLLCAICKECFYNPWDLMVHVQAAHLVNIYDLGVDEANDHATIAGSTANATVANENINRSPAKINNGQNDVTNANVNAQTNVNGTHNTTNANNDVSSKDIVLNKTNKTADHDKESSLSPNTDINMENALLLSLSSTPLLSGDGTKTNGTTSPSSSCACSPRLEQISPSTSSPCTIVAALSIESAPSSSSVASIGHVSPPVVITNGSI